MLRKNTPFSLSTEFLLWLSIGIFNLFAVPGLIFKYVRLGYNALDLAIYNQVFYNTSMGRLFEFTIHPHSYLGDHAEFFLLFLVPLYTLIRHPLTLLILQALAVSLAAVPLYLCTKIIAHRTIALITTLLYLGSPFVHNIVFFEFHLLPFALPLLFFSIFFYLRQRFLPFLLFLVLALSVREDVALFTVMFAFLAAWDQRPRHWILTPLLVSIGWFTGALLLTSSFNPNGFYKFLIYYSWIGDSIPSIARWIFGHPWEIFLHLLEPKNLLFMIALFLPFLFLPFVRPRFLLLAFLPALQLLLGNFGGELILKTHYSTLLLPPLFLAEATALAYFFNPRSSPTLRFPKFLTSWIQKEKGMAMILITVAAIYAMLTFGPFFPLLSHLIQNPRASQDIKLKSQWLRQIPRDRSVSAPYDLLAPLSGRPRLFSNHYLYIGKKQYSLEPYDLPPIDLLFLDTKDFLTYEIQYPKTSFYGNVSEKGDDRFRSAIQNQDLHTTQTIDSLILFDKNREYSFPIIHHYITAPPIEHSQSLRASPNLEFLGWTTLDASETLHPTFGVRGVVLPLALFWKPTGDVTENEHLELNVLEKSGKTIVRKIYPLGNGINPPREWPKELVTQTNHWFLLPPNIHSSSHRFILQVVRRKTEHSYLGMDGMLSATPKNTNYEGVGETIVLEGATLHERF